MRLVVLLAAAAPASSFKLPWSRSAGSAAPKSGGYQLGDISKVSRVPLSTPMWEDDASEPVLVHDHLGPTDDKAYLEAYKYKKLERGEDPVQRVLYEHSLTYQGLSYNKQ